MRVTMASARGRDAPGHGPVATTTSGEWIWYTLRKCSGATPICSAIRRRFSATCGGIVVGADAAIEAVVDAAGDAAFAGEERMTQAGNGREQRRSQRHGGSVLSTGS